MHQLLKLALHDTDNDFLARILADSTDTPTFPRKSARGCPCQRRGIPALVGLQYTLPRLLTYLSRPLPGCSLHSPPFQESWRIIFHEPGTSAAVACNFPATTICTYIRRASTQTQRAGLEAPQLYKTRLLL